MRADRSAVALHAADDAILVGRAAAGDTAAFAVLVRRHLPLLRVLITRIVGSSTDADDVVQESFVIAWREMSQLRDASAVRACR
ncbi:RNA polymerase sigma factor [Microbacterium sp. LMI1-1-1.1]|uniref:RNA polymerase sigma factor n=1 Tax=Microbacterium sp. LMI1-1-1.1 TaxID=3135223 RepID=UPI003466ED03